MASLKAKLAETTKARKAAIAMLNAAIGKVKVEKRLKAKEAKLQAKLAALSVPEK